MSFRVSTMLAELTCESDDCDATCEGAVAYDGFEDASTALEEIGEDNGWEGEKCPDCAKADAKEEHELSRAKWEREGGE